MNISGETTDGKKIIQGLGKMYYQDGMPLSVAFLACISSNLMPDWTHLYEELLDNKISHKRIMHLFNEHISDSYGTKMRDTVINNLKTIYGEY